MSRSIFPFVLAIAVIGAACSNDDVTADPVVVDQPAPSPAEDVPSALEDPTDDTFPDPLIDLTRLRSGGPPPDGIPSIDDPRFLVPAEVTFLDDREPVLALEIDGDSRAYPLAVMIWHEVVNDTVGGVPVAVTYCPLCNSAIAYDRRLDDRILDFGTSGMLYNSALVMYDRQTESLWSHFTGEAVAGHLTGSVLETHPVSTVSWVDWRAANPDGLVLSRQTGVARDYGRNPYPGYDDVTTSPFLFDGVVDGRLAAKERVVGIERDGEAIAVVLDDLADDGVAEFDLGGEPLVVWVRAGTTSALDASSIDGGRDVGATGVFVPVADGQALTFRSVDAGFVDEETGTTWNVLGQAVAGPLEGAALEAVAHVDTFWFAWAAFQPDTMLVP